MADLNHRPGVDGRGLAVLAWCSCGWHRTTATRGRGWRAIARHLAVWERLEREFPLTPVGR